MIGIVFDGGESVEALVSQNALRAKFCWTNHDPEEKMLSWRKKSKDKPIRLSEEFFVSDRSFLFFVFLLLLLLCRVTLILAQM